MTIKIGKIECHIQHIPLNGRDGAVISRKLLDGNAVACDPQCPIKSVLAQTHRQYFGKLRPHIHCRHGIQNLSVIAVDRFHINSLGVNMVRRDDIRKIGKASEILDEPAEMRACPVDISNCLAKLLLISVRVCQICSNVVFLI